jgi:hypothetical protein
VIRLAKTFIFIVMFLSFSFFASKVDASLTFGDEYLFFPEREGAYGVFGWSIISSDKLDSYHFVIVYPDPDNFDYGTARIGTISGDTISYGPKHVFNSDAPINQPTPYSWVREGSPSLVASLDSTHFVVIYGRYCTLTANEEYPGTARIGTISGDTIAFGSEYVFKQGNVGHSAISSLDATHFVITYDGKVKIGEVSGDTISYGSEYAFDTGRTYDISVSPLDSSRFVVAYADAAHHVSGWNAPFTWRGSARIGTVSGKTITFGDEYRFVGKTDNAKHISVSALDSNRFVVVYSYEGPYTTMGYEGHLKIGTVSGNTISFGSKFKFYGSPNTSISSCRLDATHFALTYAQLAPAAAGGYAKVGEVLADNSISFHGGGGFIKVGAAYFPSIFSLDNNRFLITYRHKTDQEGWEREWYQGAAKIGTYSFSAPTPTPTPEPGSANLNLKIRFEGVDQQRSSKTVKVVLKKGGTVINSFENIAVSADVSGVYTANLTNLDPGTYDVLIKGWAHLQKKFEGVVLEAGENDIDWSRTVLLAGDIDDNNKINIQDLGVLSRDYRESSSPADFNLDGIVNIQDFTHIAINYRKTGDE